MGPMRRSLGWFFGVGRASRRAYWLEMIPVFVCILLYDIVTRIWGAPKDWPSTLAMLAIIPPALCVAVFGSTRLLRRLHDLGLGGDALRSAALTGAGYRFLVELLDPGPIRTILDEGLALMIVAFVVYLGAKPGQPFENRYGPPPETRRNDASEAGG